MTEKIILSIKNLKKDYGTKDNPLYALNDVSMDICKGEFISITGESGSGKTTLLNVLGTIDTADSGEIYFEGEPITGKDDNYLSAYRRKEIGFIFQSYNLIPVLNVEENIMLPVNLDSASVDEEYYKELLSMVGLESKRYSFPHELSGGQKQRVAFVRALIHKPKIILADEPTGNLDSKNGKEIITILKNSIRKYEQTLVLVTHDGNIACQADRIFEMSDGCIVQKR